MTQADTKTEEPPKKKSKLPLLIGLIGALALGGGGFYATYSGLILAASDGHAPTGAGAKGLPDIAFIPVDPITISLGPQSRAKHLRFASQLEVESPHVAEVRLLLPRISDVLNSYLRAVELVQLEDPAALMRLKAQMLRRIQIVTGQDRVRDLLISEFVLN
ncbi:MAG: flagellar basal body-associated FliL family protein [Pseudotabrizicola sp.]|uniref:flagellar basal body-associated FliL family protein n=1 Tax=Pseudotabrizicola sp. TaxID=2939647 RepID=UPI00271C1E57|nr:flagellar basal body-associated FliL family protein [Pseudotabrizicola sp.]MDO8882509.1 flagellar basal body-associated FliL family protein [Pseudotabrizicola sp.]MDP2082086.1 flagellar basal body-associated FliL family protein [Pseudotabrizicola sp.]MDZ7576479.1 flagellar basal body-associated FliL family protein [Pseudotabrizicola sp.]